MVKEVYVSDKNMHVRKSLYKGTKKKVLDSSERPARSPIEGLAKRKEAETHSVVTVTLNHPEHHTVV